MSPTRINEIAERHLDEWFSDDPQLSRKTLREYVADAISAALYEEGCQTNTLSRTDMNNPVFIRHCGPQPDSQ